MKRIAIFPNGAGVIDTESNHSVKINCCDPIEYVEYNEKNMRKYFKSYKKGKSEYNIELHRS